MNGIHCNLITFFLFYRYKRNLNANSLAVPVARREMLSLSPIERRMTAQVQPFARIFKTHGGADGIHGPVTFVPLEAQRFQEGVVKNTLEEKRTLLGRIYRHPEAIEPFYHELLSTERLKDALDILKDNHSEYRFLNFPSDSLPVSTLNSDEFLAASRSIDPQQHPAYRNKLLSKVKSFDEFEQIWKVLRDQHDAADREDILLIETANTEEHDYESSFLVNWKAKLPMVVFLHDTLPVEATAFPYIFWKGAEGTFGSPDTKTGLLTWADYVKLRALCVTGVVNLDR